MPVRYEALPATMRALQVMAPGRAGFIEIPLPELRPGHALVRTRLLSLCGSDVQWLHHFDPEDYPMAPGTTGHEVIGEVVAHDAPDCHLPPGRLALTLIPDHTGMAEYCLVKARDVLYLPPDAPPAHLLQAQQFGTVIYACKQLPNVIGQDVVVIGQGSAGLWFDRMLRRMGARRVIAIDLQAHRLQAGKLYGATDIIHNAEADAVAAVAELTGDAWPTLSSRRPARSRASTWRWR